MTERFSLETLAAAADLLARSGRVVEVSFSGSSMMPTIASGQVVLLSCGRMPELQEVAVIMSRRQLLVHRMVHRAPSFVMTRGDANPFPDPPLFESSRTDVGTIIGLQSPTTTVPIPPYAPDSFQIFMTRLCVAAVSLHPGFGSAVIRLLWIARRLCWLWPKRLLRALAP